VLRYDGFDFQTTRFLEVSLDKSYRCRIPLSFQNRTPAVRKEGRELKK